MSVLEFKRPDEDVPHVAGDCICANCRYEWVSTAPVGTTQLECPVCGTRRGAFMYPFGPREGDDSFHCNCGSETFFITRKVSEASGSVYCRGCGLEAVGWFE